MPKFVLDFSQLIGGATYAGWNEFYDAQSVRAILPESTVTGKFIKLVDEHGQQQGLVNVASLALLPVEQGPGLDPSLLWFTGEDGEGNSGFHLRLDSGPSWPSSIVLPDSIAYADRIPATSVPAGSIYEVPNVLLGTVTAYRNAFLAAIQTNLDKSFSEFDFYEQVAGEATVFGHFEASKPGDPIPTFTGRQMLDGTANFDHFDFEVIGSDYADYITGNTGVNTFIGSLGSDELTGGGKNDTFDYTDLRDELGIEVDFDAFTPGTSQRIDGGAEDKTSSVNGGLDVLKLPGSAVDYTIKLDFFRFVTPQPGDPVNWPETSYDIISPKQKEFAPTTPNVTMRLTNVEKVTFEKPVDNIVTPHLGSVATEALALASEVYGLLPTLGHEAEDLGYETVNAGDVQSYNPNVASLAKARGWHPLQAIELGIRPADFNDPALNGLRYSLENGFYAAYKPSDLVSIVSDTPEANALVLTGMLNGKRTLAIAFRGTDQFADMSLFGNFSFYYAKFKPLVDAVRNYVGDDANGIQQVLVSGHSLGAGAVQYFMHEHDGNPIYRAYTDGSPGGDHVYADREDPRIMNLMRTDDAVTFVPDITAKTSDPLSKLALLGLTTGITTLASGGGPIIAGGVAFGTAFLNDIIITSERKYRQGGEVFLDSPISDDFSDLKEHDKASYVTDMANLNLFAQDAGSPFYTTQLAINLRSQTVYSGPAIHIALGRSTPPRPRATMAITSSPRRPMILCSAGWAMTGFCSPTPRESSRTRTAGASSMAAKDGTPSRCSVRRATILSPKSARSMSSN